MTAEQWSRLDTEAQGRLHVAEQAPARPRHRLSEVEASIGVEEIDALLDRLASITRMVAGKLTAEDVPALGLQLAEVFEDFRLHRDGRQVSK